jgi:hypothetical protein
MAKPNYSFEKRQRERLKKQKKEEKLAQRKSGTLKPEDAASDEPTGETTAPDSPQPVGNTPV